jgi:hypothetical protein
LQWPLPLYNKDSTLLFASLSYPRPFSYCHLTLSPQFSVIPWLRVFCSRGKCLLLRRIFSWNILVLLFQWVRNPISVRTFNYSDSHISGSTRTPISPDNWSCTLYL